jgi:hypothetical protein
MHASTARPAMGFNKRKMDDRRRQAAEKEAAAGRATEKQILEDAEHLIAVWNERQAKRMPMLFSPTIGAAITAGYWFLRARCPACRTVGDVDLRTAVIALSPTSEQAAQSGRRMRGSAALNGMMHNQPSKRTAGRLPGRDRAPRCPVGASRPRWFDTTMQLGQFVDRRPSRSIVAARSSTGACCRAGRMIEGLVERGAPSTHA